MERWKVKTAGKVPYNGRFLEAGEEFSATRDQLESQGLLASVRNVVEADKADKGK